MSSLPVSSLILGIGASFGLLWIMATVPAAQRVYWLLAGLLTLLGALIGSRAGYVLEHLAYFSSHPDEMVQFWLGGLTWEGAVAGAILVQPAIVKLFQWPFHLVLDAISRFLLPLSIAGWIDCWMVGLGYGIVLDKGMWWGLAMSNEAGVVSLRNPVQPLAILSLLVFLGVLELWLSHTEKLGLRGFSTLLIFGADMLLFSFLRADPSPSWLGLRIETWSAIVYTLVGILGTIGFFFEINKAWVFRKPVHAESKPL